MLHVLNGDATRSKLETSGIPGEITVWADALHDGPVPAVPAAELRRIRAKHLADGAGASNDGVEATLAEWDARLERYSDHEEVVFWLEHDLFDQILLIRHLDWLAGVDRGTTRFTLICIGSFPGVENFTGLGPLSPSQLATLLPLREPISGEQIATGRAAWSLFRSDDPRPLAAWVAGAGTEPLPFLPGALRRHLEDFPSVRDGLSRSERQILEVLAAGHRTFPDVFVATQRLEERVFMGDMTAWSIVRRLANGPRPLVTLSTNEHSAAIELTAAARDVLAGAADHLDLNGIDRWMGGCHLTTDRHWRWDGASLVAARRN